MGKIIDHHSSFVSKDGTLQIQMHTISQGNSWEDALKKYTDFKDQLNNMGFDEIPWEKRLKSDSYIK